ncbi:MAG: polymer-forming cytoskeletal protein, partial [Rickettsiales bacterium]|nr:polymer-forming cytoskeletal protein [Rickettsiales bacterium]
MFRRREDSLFDNATDPSGDVDVQESATVISPSSSTTSQPTATPAYLSSQPQQPARTPEARPAAQPASSFRPTPPANPTADLARSRMPEPKPASPTPPSPASAFTVAGNKAGKRVLTVGNDILLKGEIATCDRLVIEGKVDATLNDVHTVEIAETGSFKGSAHIEDAEISGLFEGDLIVRNRLVIYATGKVRGKIT